MEMIKKESKIKEFGNQVKAVFNLRNNVRDLKDLKSSLKIMMFIMLAAELGSFIFAKDFSINGWIVLATGIFTVVNLILDDGKMLTNFSWGTLSCAVWLLVAVHNRLIGDIFSQTFYLVMQFVGIPQWFKLANEDNESKDNMKVTPRKLDWKMGLLITIGVAVVYIIDVFTSKSLHGNQVYLDAALLPIGIAGQILMTFGMRSQWILWIVLDVVNVIIWFNQLHTGDSSVIAMFVLQICMLINAFYGMYEWYKDDKKDINEKDEINEA